ncbi:MAG TPA: hypothetical protein VKP69_00705 [Isosphaeraceae bacterium]|nr:hypothetical protein [Isosphaeraceae bacterium]
MKRTLKTLTVAATLALPALAGCSGEHQEANPPTAAPAADQPKIIEKPAPPTSTPDQKPKQEEAPKGA